MELTKFHMELSSKAERAVEALESIKDSLDRLSVKPSTRHEPLCPECSRELDFIETVNQSDEEMKTSWNCGHCDILIYLVRFQRDQLDR